jgi:solute carrier family 25 phosphate transporter 23/24/25/41
MMARAQGKTDGEVLSGPSRFVAGGLAGVISQFAVYPIDTLKFRMQCEIVEGGKDGNQLIVETFKKMWSGGGTRSFYRGLSLGLLGIFPMAALDFGSFEYMKREIAVHYAERDGCEPDTIELSNVTTAAMGATSGAIGATCVYPINVLRTRLQTQGSVLHPQTYDGIMDVTRKTIRKEGYRALFKGLTPNLLKVVPAVSIVS